MDGTEGSAGQPGPAEQSHRSSVSSVGARGGFCSLTSCKCSWNGQVWGGGRELRLVFSLVKGDLAKEMRKTR